MKYGVEKNGVSVDRDFYAEHFATTSDEIKINYIVKLYGDTIDEGEDVKELGARLIKMGQQLEKVGKFLKTKAKQGA